MKRPGQKPTEAQSAFLRNVRAAGGLAVVVHSVQELERVLLGARGEEGAGG
jgi:hypothetical protein